jgi:hypothetical protein
MVFHHQQLAATQRQSARLLIGLAGVVFFAPSPLRSGAFAATLQALARHLSALLLPTKKTFVH